MNALRARNILAYRLPTGLLLLTIGCCLATADTKKPTTPAPAKTPVKSSGTGAKPAGAAVAHGATAGAAHGPTTAGAAHGPTTAGAAAHGPTTNGAASRSTPASVKSSAGGATNQQASVIHQPSVTKAGRPAPTNQKVISTKSGDEVRVRPGGKPSDVHVASRGMDIHHGLNGTRRVEVVRGDHTRIVAERGGRGYVQHPYIYGGREYGHRTYYYGGQPYDRYYYGYPYHGVYVNMYSPAYYYQPAFYGWAYNPWVSPVSYGWGWGGNPWYGYYGSYFTPYPVYPSASVWLTDYLISTTLAAAYQARVDTAVAAQAEGAVALTAVTKDLISAEVQRQIAIENAESQPTAQSAAPNPSLSGVQAMLADTNVKHVFVAGATLDVVDATGAECEITEGDALQLTGPTEADATAANLAVLSTKGGKECRAGATVSIAVADLQEMQNHMRETIDQGMGDLQSKQSKGGLPAIPLSAKGEPVKAAFAAQAPGPDPTAATQIAQQAQEADQAEKDVLSHTQQASGPGPSVNALDAVPSGAPAPAPVSIDKGQSISDVTGALGQPVRIFNLGAKKIYVYKDMKITFNDGKVTDIQ